MASRLTILELTASGDTAGATRSIAALVEGLSGRGHRVILGARPESHIYRELSGRGITAEPIAFRRKLSLSDAKRVAHLAAFHHADLVNAHSSKDRYAAILARILFGMRASVVVTRRVMPSSGGGFLQAIFYSRGAQKTVAVSNAVRQALVRSGMSPERVVTIPNGFPPSRFRRKNPGWNEDLARDLGFRKGVPVLGVVSRLKDQDDLLRAARRIDRPLSILFLGVRRSSRFARLEEALGGRHVVRYLDFVWDVLPYYGLLDISILPSRIEGLSQTLLESMALGIPTISSRAGGNVDVVRDGENGLLYEPRCPDALAHRIETLLSDRELCDKIREAAKRTALETYTLERTINATEELYRSVCNGDGGGG